MTLRAAFRPTLWQTLSTLLPPRFRPSRGSLHSFVDPSRSPSPAQVNAVLTALRAVLVEMGIDRPCQVSDRAGYVEIVIGEEEIDAFAARFTDILLLLAERVPPAVRHAVMVDAFVRMEDA